MKKNKKEIEEKIIKPKGKILLTLLNIIGFVSCVLSSYYLYKFRSTGGKLE